jgi:hypothetical protein
VTGAGSTLAVATAAAGTTATTGGFSAAAFGQRRQVRGIAHPDGLEAVDLDEPSQIPQVASRDQRQGDTDAAHAGGAAGAVRVGLEGRGEIEVDDEIDMLEIQPASGDIGGDHVTDFLAAESAKERCPLVLLHSAVDHFDGIQLVAKLAEERVGVIPRIAEHNHLLGFDLVEMLQEPRQTLAGLDLQEGML